MKYHIPKDPETLALLKDAVRTLSRGRRPEQKSIRALWDHGMAKIDIIGVDFDTRRLGLNKYGQIFAAEHGLQYR